MNVHFSEQLIEQYRQRALPPAELLDADDHLATCETCRQRLGDEQRAQATARSLRADLAATGLTHLAYEQLAAYVEGSLDQTDREIADSHLELCAQCAEELDDLRAFATQIGADPTREYAPVTPASLGHKPSSFAKGWREWVEGVWRSPAFWLPVRLASIGLIVALLLWAALLKSQNSQLQTALDDERRENGKLKQDYQAAVASVAELQNQLAQINPIKGGTPSDSSIVATLNDGAGQVTLDKEGNLAGVALPFQQAVKQALTTERIETPQMLSELIGKSDRLMGSAGEGYPFALLGPIGTVTMNDRPTFRWGAFGDADSYVVRIYDADFNEVAVSPQLSETSWTVTRALGRGRIYSWQVTARVGDKEVASPVRPAPEARFMVLDQAKANELAKAKSDSAGSHLTLGILYAEAGLLDDAERELQALLRANPQSALAEKLLRSVRAKRRS
ncbi:MAG: anti-sigma factor family protein [Blastocatellia bacterium]